MSDYDPYYNAAHSFEVEAGWEMFDEAHPRKAAMLNVLASNAWQNNNLDKASDYLLLALRAIRADTSPDIKLWAWTLRRLAYALQFLEDPVLIGAAWENLRSLPSTDAFGDLRCEVYRRLGRRACLDGAFEHGLALYKLASEMPFAPSTSRLIAILNRAELAHWMDERFFFEDSLAEAMTLEAHVNWQTAGIAAREVLLHLAQMQASRDGALAFYFAARFKSLGGFDIDNVTFAALAVAQQNYCLGMLYVGTGEQRKGVAMLETAYADYDRLRLVWAAGQTAIVLAETTHSEAWRSQAKQLLARYPRSYFGKRLLQLDELVYEKRTDIAKPAP